MSIKFVNYAKVSQKQLQARGLSEADVSMADFDVADYLLTQEDIDSYLTGVLEDFADDPDFIELTMADIAKAQARLNMRNQEKTSSRSLVNFVKNLTQVAPYLSAYGLQLKATPRSAAVC